MASLNISQNRNCKSRVSCSNCDVIACWSEGTNTVVCSKSAIHLSAIRFVGESRKDVSDESYMGCGRRTVS